MSDIAFAGLDDRGQFQHPLGGGTGALKTVFIFQDLMLVFGIKIPNP